VVELEVDDGLAVITVDRPHARNAIGPATMDELEKAIADAEGALALVITGGGDRAFISGGDLKELAAIRTETEAIAMSLRMRAICDQLSAFPAPVIAALNGHALGGGAEVAVAADIRIAADDVRIGFNQVTLAIMPAWGGAERLARLVGPGRALLLAGAGTVLNAEQAHQIGLVDVVVPRTNFAEQWRAIARSLAIPSAVAIKRVTAGPVSALEAAQAFARLWIADEHWEAAERMMNRGG
jgi:enoyl-CoA hydratase/carnithine racemase